jgi:hypothetical protein
MTRYEVGFMNKCAEYGVPLEMAVSMLKSAQDGFQAPDASGNVILDGSTGTVMQKGDTVSGIMKRLKIPQRYLQAVLRENGLTEESARRLRPGHTIYTRSDPGAYAPPPPATPAVAPQAASTNSVTSARGR